MDSIFALIRKSEVPPCLAKRYTSTTDAKMSWGSEVVRAMLLIEFCRHVTPCGPEKVDLFEMVGSGDLDIGEMVA
jgi:hypothetical protein